jgi:hypothetical protein
VGEGGRGRHVRVEQWEGSEEMISPRGMAMCKGLLMWTMAMCKVSRRMAMCCRATLTVSGPNHCPTFRSHIMPPCAIRCIPKIALASSANQLSTSTYFLGGGLSLTMRQSRLK